MLTVKAPFTEFTCRNCRRLRVAGRLAVSLEEPDGAQSDLCVDCLPGLLVNRMEIPAGGAAIFRDGTMVASAGSPVYMHRADVMQRVERANTMIGGRSCA